MSARVFWGLAPAGKPHPAAKWSLLMALLVGVMLGVPNLATAGQPTVKPPTGPVSGGVFTGPFTFDTYISCTSGLSFNSSYTSNLEGTHTFGFFGAADGSLLVTIDGGGMLLVTSCGDPLTGPFTNVASYTVTKDSTPPTPTPTPTPPPTPVPTPTPHTSTPPPSSTPGNTTRTPRPTSTPTAAAGPSVPPPAPSSQPENSPTPTPTPTVSSPPIITSAGPGYTPPSGANQPVSSQLSLPWKVSGMALLALVTLVLCFWRVPRLRYWLRGALLPLYLAIEPRWLRLRARIRSWCQRHRPIIHGRELPRRQGLSHHHHTGKVLAHHHTSYPALVFLIILSTLLVIAASLAARADSSLLTITVPGPPPSVAATIDQPIDGARFATPTQTIRGTCPTGLIIELYRNSTFAGASLCDANGLYAVLITITPGANQLVARDLDGLGQYGPDSNTIIIYYDEPPSPTPTPTPSSTPTPTSTPSSTPTPTASPSVSPSPSVRPSTPPHPTPTPTRPPTTDTLLLHTDRHYYQGADPDTPVNWTISVTGGRAPYHMTWDWGDGVRDTLQVAKAMTVNRSHRYAKPGTYQITIRARDTARNEAVIQVVAIINGPTTTTAVTRSKPDPGNLIYIWPLLIMTSILVLCFWLGERHKLAMLRPTIHQPTPRPSSQ